MKTKLAQFVSFVSELDRRHIQYAHSDLTLVGFAAMQKPSDGSIGPFMQKPSDGSIGPF